MEPLVRLEQISLTLPSQAGNVEILKGISLNVGSGESIAIVGPSGSGKSSLLMVLGGLERATGGAVTVLGEDLTLANEDELAALRRGRIGVVFQSFHLIPTMTAVENVQVPLEISGHSDPVGRANEMLAAVWLAGRSSHYPAQLSGGEQQRIALARALAPGPELLLADEPTGNLDGETGAQVTDLMFDLAKQFDATLIMVTHSDMLAKRCSRIVRLHDGRIAA